MVSDGGIQTTMIDHRFFSNLKEQHDTYDQKRHQVIKDSSDILKDSKRAIFALHRDNIDDVQQFLKKAEERIQKIQQQITKEPRLRFEGSFSAALEEYVEAYCFSTFIVDHQLNIPTIIDLHYDELLGGLTDVTGEIVRKAVLLVTKGKFDDVQEYHSQTSAIIEELILLDMTGKLRTKYDQAKRNLQRLEEILYDIKIKQ